MQFRSPTDIPIRLALTSGHTAIVGEDWRELPSLFHYAAVRAGCQRSDSAPPPQPVVMEAGENAMNQTPDHATAYRKAIMQMLEREEEGDFTGASLPNINAVSKLCGFVARKEGVLEVFRDMKHEVIATPMTEAKD